MNTEQARNYTCLLLDRAKVKTVYYIDDYLSFDGLRSITEYIENTPLDVLRERIPELDERVIFAKDASWDGLSTYISEWWASISESVKDLILKNCDLSPSGFSEPTLKMIIGGARCCSCTPEEWEETRSKECLEQINKGEIVMLLFDFKLGAFSSSNGDTTGITLANSFKNNPHVVENSFCGIFSREFEIDEEFKFRNDHKSELSNWAFPLAKSRIKEDNDLTPFIEGLKNVLWVPDVQVLNDLSAQMISDVSKKLEEEFRKINPPEFKQLVINSSLKEGCREIDSLLRLIHIVFDKQIRKSLTDETEKLIELTDHIERIVGINDVADNIIKNRFERNTVHDYFQDESYIPGPIINKLLTPLQNGDVFLVNKKYHILLCQPCNISIRSGGKRSNDNDCGFFVPLNEVGKEDGIQSLLLDIRSCEEAELSKRVSAAEQDINKYFKTQNGLIACDIDGKQWSAAIEKYKTISLSLLDFATFSEDGKVIINRDYSLRLHRNQVALANNHKKKYKKMCDIEPLLSGLDDDCKVILNLKIHNHLLNFLKKHGVTQPEDSQIDSYNKGFTSSVTKEINERFRLSLKPGFERWYFTLLLNLGITPTLDDDNTRYIFPIERVGHLMEPYSTDLLTKLSQYISRAAFPNVLF